MDPIEFYLFEILPTLKYLEMDSKAATILVLGTALTESNLQHITQKTNDVFTPGPGLGLLQMEKATHDDIWLNFLQYRTDVRAKIQSLCAPWPERYLQLMGNLPYAVAMCRLKYLRSPDILPHAEDYAGMALMWKKVYNTAKGAGKESQFLAHSQILSQANSL